MPKKFYYDEPTAKRRRGQQWAAVKALKSLQDAESLAVRRAMLGEEYKSANPLQRRMRNGLQYYGKGDYRKYLRYIPRGLGALAGGAAGWMAGKTQGIVPGAMSGWEAGANFSKKIGWGDYTSANQIMSSEGMPVHSQQNISVNQSNSSGDVFIEHTEFVQNIYASVTSGPSASPFQVTRFSINPGMVATFPFLSQIAQNFELYELQGCIFQYKPTSGEYGNNSSNSLGKVILATQYDPTSDVFLNSVQMENYDYANSVKPSNGATHGVECHPDQRSTKMLYVRSGSTSKSLIDTDIGTFSVATEGIPFGGAGAQSANVGELWVTYKVRLSRANLVAALLGRTIQCSSIFVQPSATAMVPSSGVTYKVTNTLPVTIANVSATAATLTFPANIQLGYYIVALSWEGTAGTQTFVNPTSASNLTYFRPQVLLPSASVNAIRGPFGAVSSIQKAQIFYIKINAPGALVASLQIGVSAAFTAGDILQVQISQVSSDMAETIA